jgi:arginyl-tRNA synthetase
MRNPNTHLIFDVELAKKQTNENPLYYVQYAHARIASIFEKAKNIIDVDKINSFKNYKLSDNDRKILKKIFWFEKILNQSLKDLSPHHITTYLIELAGDFHSYYEKNRIIDEKDTITTSARLLILKGIKKTLQKGLDIIGVTAPQKM